eukprot:g11770.t1
MCASVKNLRNAGFTDTASVAALRKLRVEAWKMKLGGFTLSDMRNGGYSSAELRLAGFSSESIAALEKPPVHLHGESVYRSGGFFKLNRQTKLRQIDLQDYRGTHDFADQDEVERDERRKRGLYGLSNSEKACFTRFERRRSKSQRSEISVAELSEVAKSERSEGSPKNRRRLAVLLGKRLGRRF